MTPPAPEKLAALVAGALPFRGLAPETLDALAAASRLHRFESGAAIYEPGASARDIFIVASGAARLERPTPTAQALDPVVHPGEAFGWTALASGARRHRAVAIEDSVILSLPGQTLVDLAARDPGPGKIARENILAAVDAIDTQTPRAKGASTLDLRLYQFGLWLRGPKPALMLAGFLLALGVWYASVELLRLPRFADMPGPTTVFREWLSANPTYGVSIHTPIYYQHIWISLRRVLAAFVLATFLGAPVGLMLGWSKKFYDYVFPIFEMLRPIPILAWTPLAIVMLPGDEAPVLFLTFLASFFATALNAMLGVRSIDPALIQAAQCLGASRAQIFRHVVIPGALPHLFTGLQISIGVAWFSLVAAEMVSGQFGLGYLINTSYTSISYPTIVIAMLTLGAVGSASSALVRLVGGALMSWRGRELSIGAGS